MFGMTRRKYPHQLVCEFAKRPATQPRPFVADNGESMPSIYYKPADALHWLLPANRGTRDASRKKAKVKDERTLTETLRLGFSAAVDFGNEALTDFRHRRMDEILYLLNDDSFEAISLSTHKKVGFDKVRAIYAEEKDRFRVEYDGGTLTIKPLAHLVSGRVRVPIGWNRNGIEVPYTLLPEEIAARCGVEIDSE